MATTAKGTPYVESSDLVANYPAASLALANRIDTVSKILQVVTATTSTEVNSSSTSYADTTLTATITPTLATSTILVMVSQTGLNKYLSNNSIYLRLLRGATELVIWEKIAGNTNSTAHNWIASSSLLYRDSPATTSATTYKTQLRADSATASVGVQWSSSMSSIVLMEVSS